jgi:hypothetical protein
MGMVKILIVGGGLNSCQSVVLVYRRSGVGHSQKVKRPAAKESVLNMELAIRPIEFGGIRQLESSLESISP